MPEDHALSVSFSSTHGRLGGAVRSQQSPLLALRVWLHRRSLKRALANGAEPDSSPELAHRAEQLTSLGHRRSLAVGLNRTLRDAQGPPPPVFTAAVPLQRHAILSARDEIEQLAHDLLAPGDVQPRGVALVQDLLTDGSSPLFTPSPEGALDQVVGHAHAALLLR